MKKTACIVFALSVMFIAPQAKASMLFTTFLTGVDEVPPNASPATGLGLVLLNDLMNMITVDENWTGLTAPATASHIHTGPPGVAGPITFPFTGVPAATSGAIPEQSFAITPAQVADLIAGNMYMNVHSSNFPGGEIRGQLTTNAVGIPEPATFGLIGSALAGLALVRRKRA
jgi:hypothetical protein